VRCYFRSASDRVSGITDRLDAFVFVSYDAQWKTKTLHYNGLSLAQSSSDEFLVSDVIILDNAVC